MAPSIAHNPGLVNPARAARPAEAPDEPLTTEELEILLLALYHNEPLGDYLRTRYQLALPGRQAMPYDDA